MENITRQDIIDYCLTFPAAYADYPFDSVLLAKMKRGAVAIATVPNKKRMKKRRAMS